MEKADIKVQGVLSLDSLHFRIFLKQLNLYPNSEALYMWELKDSLKIMKT